MKNLKYTTFEIQPYLLLEDFPSDVAKSVFKWRTKMASFGENYRSGKDHVLCKLCQDQHLDSQEESFNCGIMKQYFNINHNYSDIFSEIYIPSGLANTIHTIQMFKEEARKLSSV